MKQCKECGFDMNNPADPLSDEIRDTGVCLFCMSENGDLEAIAELQRRGVDVGGC
jgi:hypothetical protein